MKNEDRVIKKGFGCINYFICFQSTTENQSDNAKQKRTRNQILNELEKAPKTNTMNAIHGPARQATAR